MEKDLTGQVFTRLKVLKRAPPKIVGKNRKPRRAWICECNCNNHTILTVSEYNLIKGYTKSCGCLNRELASQRMKKYREKMGKESSRFKYNENGEIILKKCKICNQWKELKDFGKSSKTLDKHVYYCLECEHGNLDKRYSRYKSGAKHRKIEFNLTKQQFDYITSLPCGYCGHFSNYYYEKGYSGVDRIDSNKAYSVDNVISCCEICNQLKTDLSWNDFIEKILQIYSNLERKGFYAELYVPNE